MRVKNASKKSACEHKCSRISLIWSVKKIYILNVFDFKALANFGLNKGGAHNLKKIDIMEQYKI